MAKRLLTDEQWERIKSHLPKHEQSSKGGRPRASDRESLEGILWLVRTGARWRDIPAHLPSRITCWRRLVEWEEKGVLKKIKTILSKELGELGRLRLKELAMDATFIRKEKRRRRLRISSMRLLTKG